jgi:hypothetical protein
MEEYEGEDGVFEALFQLAEGCIAPEGDACVTASYGHLLVELYPFHPVVCTLSSVHGQQRRRRIRLLEHGSYRDDEMSAQERSIQV